MHFQPQLSFPGNIVGSHSAFIVFVEQLICLILTVCTDVRSDKVLMSKWKNVISQIAILKVTSNTGQAKKCCLVYLHKLIPIPCLLVLDSVVLVNQN